jgi:hypothetical protein
MTFTSGDSSVSRGPTEAREAYHRKSQAYAAEIAPIVVAMRQRGLLLRQIAAELHARDVATLRGGSWTPTAIRRLLLARDRT